MTRKPSKGFDCVEFKRRAQDPTFFGFFSLDLAGFSGIGHSVEDCLYQARWGMEEHVALLREQGLPVPPENANATVTIRNEIKVAVA